jgi:hypothetical protein
MTSIIEFDGTGDVITWASKVRAILIAKGYKGYLFDINKPKELKEQMIWEVNVDKATGIVLTYLHPNIQMQFESQETPQSLIEAVVKRFCPDQQQEIDRLEKEFNELKYDGSDPVVWTANIRGLIAKLAIRKVVLTERTIRNTVLKALEQEQEYKIKVEIIRHNEPDISIDNLWIAIGRLPYPLQQVENAFAALKLTSYSDETERAKDKNKDTFKHRAKRCYICGNYNHLAYNCPKRKYFDSDSDEEQSSSRKNKSKNSSSDEKKIKEKEKEKKKDKVNTKPHNYAFLAQVV